MIKINVKTTQSIYNRKMCHWEWKKDGHQKRGFESAYVNWGFSWA